MKQMIKFPSIPQFKYTVKEIQDKAKFIGLNENNYAIFDVSKTAPKLKFHGTVKLHGTNASVCYNKTAGLWAQSRENIITTEKDNAGFASYVNSYQAVFLTMINRVAKLNNLDLDQQSICIYGEWCGGSIQKGVALNQLPKMFVVFGVNLTSVSDEEVKSTWLDHSTIRDPVIQCYNIEDFPTYEIEIDFENPTLSQNVIIDMTTAVEDECPVGKAFGVSGIGEGIVFTHKYDDGSVIRFKAKGKKHKKTEVKTVKPVDDVKEQLKQDIAEQVTPDWRIDQAIQEVFDTNNGGTIDIKGLGEVIKWVNADIMKEELLTISESGIKPKEVMSKVVAIVKFKFNLALNLLPH